MRKFRIIISLFLCLTLTSCDPYFWMGVFMGLSTPMLYPTQNYYSTYSPNVNSVSSGYYTGSTTSPARSKGDGYLYTMVYAVGDGIDSDTGEIVHKKDYKVYRMDFYKDKLVDGDGTVLYHKPNDDVGDTKMFKTNPKVVQGVETEIWLGVNFNYIDRPQLMLFLLGDRTIKHEVHFWKESEWNQAISSGNSGGYNATSGFSGGNNINSSSEEYTRTKRTCGLCGGTGRIATTQGVTSFGNKKWCSECGKTVADNHHHETCPSCKGKGKW